MPCSLYQSNDLSRGRLGKITIWQGKKAHGRKKTVGVMGQNHTAKIKPVHIERISIGPGRGEPCKNSIQPGKK